MATYYTSGRCEYGHFNTGQEYGEEAPEDPFPQRGDDCRYPGCRGSIQDTWVAPND